MSDSEYEALAAAVERGELRVKPGTVRRGAAAAAAGAATLDLAMGRRPVGSPAGASPVVRARVPRELKAQLDALAEREHRAESDIVREAVSAYVEAHNVA